MKLFDPRLTPARADLAAAQLEGKVEAARYVEGRRMRVAAAAAPLRREPRSDAALDTEALHGEEITVYELSDEGWAWGQLVGDGYVGYVPAEDVAGTGQTPSHRVCAVRTYVYPGPNIKLPPLGAWPFGATIAVERHDSDFAVTASGGFVFAAHLMPIGAAASDYVETALRFRDAPYLWGGKTSLGLDCSALVQLALQSAGIACPRDTDMQEALVGERVANATSSVGPQRGDLVFWRGHVGMMVDGERLIHANAFHMLVAVEPLVEAIDRIEAKGGGKMTRISRFRR